MRRVQVLGPVLALCLLVAGCGSDDDSSSDSTTTTEQEVSTTAPTTEPDRTEERKSLVLAPVMSSGGCPPELGDTSGEPVESGGTYPTTDGIFCYTVGEPAADGNDLNDATLSDVEGEFQVYTRVKEESIDKLNELFNACFSGAPTCPPGEGGNGYVAIILDGTVLYAPAIQAEDIAADGFSVAGGLTERRARNIITLINR